MPDDDDDDVVDGPSLRERFIEEACVVLYRGFLEHSHGRDSHNLPGTWQASTQVERLIAAEAMSDLLDWLDARRLT